MNLFDDPEGAAIAGGNSKNLSGIESGTAFSQRLASMDSFDEALTRHPTDETYQQLAAESAEKDQVKGPLDIPGERRGHISHQRDGIRPVHQPFGGHQTRSQIEKSWLLFM